MTRSTEKLIHAALRDGCREHCDALLDELRRLHAENEAYGVHLSERMKDLAKAEAQRDALLEALQDLCDTLGECGMTEKARDAIKQAEENT